MSTGPDFHPDRVVFMPLRPRAHVWVRDGVATLTIITDAPDDFSIDWPEDAGPLIVLDSSFDVTITAVP
jgi:hypothetical protein